MGLLRRQVRDELAAEQPEAGEFLDEFNSAVPSDCVVVADMCIPGYWLAGFHQVSGPRRLSYPVGWGTLGFAFPAAIGAALGSSSLVVSVSGDGGFLFCCGELATVAQEQVPLTAVIVDDGGYGMLRYDQRSAGEEPFGVDLIAPDYEALARSFGVETETVDGLGKEFGVALADHVRRPTASVLVRGPLWIRRPPRRRAGIGPADNRPGLRRLRCDSDYSDSELVHTRDYKFRIYMCQVVVLWINTPGFQCHPPSGHRSRIDQPWTGAPQVVQYGVPGATAVPHCPQRIP